MRTILVPIIFLCIFIFGDLYFYQAVKTIAKDSAPQKQTLIKFIYWSISAFTYLTIIAMIVFPKLRINRTFVTYVTSVAFIIAIVKLLGCAVVLIEDIVRLFRVVIEFFRTKVGSENNEMQRISRLKFFGYLSLSFAAIPLASLIYGIFRGAYRYTIHRSTIKSKNIPEAFHGLKIVQISDIHTGSFTDNSALEKAFKIVLDQKPDVIFFTGDLVNNIYTETEGFMDTYKKLRAPLGVYSIFGNHDYGDYMQWDSEEEKMKAQESLKNIHKEAGWRLLWDELVELELEGEKIALMGIQNWGVRGFAQYGNLSKAYIGAQNYPFKILLSHDPSHWDHQVTTNYKDIDLTLSGHTHGLQFGIEIPGFKWSPSKYIYPNWAGLYKSGEQQLYVNRGLGFLGYPGRLGIWPEITVLTLERA